MFDVFENKPTFLIVDCAITSRDSSCDRPDQYVPDDSDVRHRRTLLLYDIFLFVDVSECHTSGRSL